MSHEALVELALHDKRSALMAHPVYARVDDLRALRIFMRTHVFAVWDFMSLLKTLQRAVTCVDVPWLPRADARAARLINLIVLGEESDEVEPGQFSSHFDLYLAAMNEVGADRGPVDRFIRALREGATVTVALELPDVPEAARRFVRATMKVAEERPIHEVAAAFLHGREDLVPEMFRRLISALDRDAHEHPSAAPDRYRSFRRYLDRHIDLDENDHAPLAHSLLRSLCGEDGAKWAEAGDAAAFALQARLDLWDGVLGEIDRPRAVQALSSTAPASP